MIKKLLLVIALVSPMCMTAQKLGVVDSKAIFDAMPEKVAAEAQLNELMARYSEENTKLEKEFNQKYADYQSLEAETPKSIKARRIQEIQENQRKISSYQQMVEQDMNARRAELLNPIKARLQSVIDSVGTEGGYSLVFDVSKTPVAFKGADVVDITSAVKTRLGMNDRKRSLRLK